MSTNKNRQVNLMMAAIAALTILFTITSVSFAAGEADTESPTVCVSGYVINHREQPVDGTKWTPALTILAEGATSPDVAATVSVTATVGANGSYSFKDLPAGLYYNFSMQLPADWDSLVPEQAVRGGIAETGFTKLNEQGAKCYDVMFKIRRWFDVTILKWEELRDGTVRPGVDWTITATPQGDPWGIKQTGKTDASGGVVLPMTPGKWLVQETIKTGWTPITPAAVYITLDQYAPPGATDPVVFKNLIPVCHASITVEKNGLGTDANGGTVWLGPLAGWKITLSRPDGAMHPVTMTTDGTGKVTFSNLRPGVYNVTEHLQPGWEAISPNPQQVIIRDCENARVLFENLEVIGKLQISGTKFFRAWVPPYQGKTVGLSGWHITATLKGTNPPVYVTTTTNALGQYMFSQATLEAAGMAIPGATIRVCEEERFHWIPVTPVCVDVRFPFPVPVTYHGAVVNFTNVQDPPLPGSGISGGGSSVDVSSCAVTHTVRPGDNLSSIAAANGTTVSALAQLNGLANPNMIRAGQTLCIQ